MHSVWMETSCEMRWVCVVGEKRIGGSMVTSLLKGRLEVRLYGMR